MSEEGRPEIGAIAWTDLTVPNAEEVRDFYAGVIGWKAEELDVHGYDDFVMNTPDGGEAAAGICHARGVNADLPPQWLIYITVKDLDASTARCTELGGKVLTEIKSAGARGRYCVVEDPAGAVAALFEESEKGEPA